MTADAPASLTPAAVEDLTRRAIAGETAATERLLQLYHRRIAGHVARKIAADLRGKVDPEDIMQDAYIQVFGGIAQLKYEHEDSFYRWVIFLCDRALIDRVRHLRRKKRDASRDAAANPSPSRHDSFLDQCLRDSTTPSRVARRAEAVSALMSAIAQLPEQDRDVVRRVYLNEERLSVVAADLERTENWLRKIGSRAIERLGKKLRAGRFLSSP